MLEHLDLQPASSIAQQLTSHQSQLHGSTSSSRPHIRPPRLDLLPRPPTAHLNHSPTMLLRPTTLPFPSTLNFNLLSSSRLLSPQTRLFSHHLRRTNPTTNTLRTLALASPRRPSPYLLTAIGLTTFTTTVLLSNPIHARFDASPFSLSSSTLSSTNPADEQVKVPLTTDGGRALNPAAIKQISFGSVAGLAAGVVVSAFSKMLVLVLGLGIVASQVCFDFQLRILAVSCLLTLSFSSSLLSFVSLHSHFYTPLLCITHLQQTRAQPYMFYNVLLRSPFSIETTIAKTSPQTNKTRFLDSLPPEADFQLFPSTHSSDTSKASICGAWCTTTPHSRSASA